MLIPPLLLVCVLLWRQGELDRALDVFDFWLAIEMIMVNITVIGRLIARHTQFIICLAKVVGLKQEITAICILAVVVLLLFGLKFQLRKSCSLNVTNVNASTPHFTHFSHLLVRKVNTSAPHLAHCPHLLIRKQ